MDVQLLVRNVWRYLGKADKSLLLVLGGEQCLLDSLVRNADLEPARLIPTQMDAVEDWTGTPELQDDMTLLVARRH